MTDEIIKIINECGIKDVGFCRFDCVSDNLLDCRAKSMIPEDARSVILCLFPYKVKNETPEKISRYAAVPDYHRVCGKYLSAITERLDRRFSGNTFEWFIDNSPIPEVYAAACAGLGVRGENGLLINSRWGSWCFIGEIVTDLEISCENNFEKCRLCGNCKKVCPRGVQGVKCLSALSQQKKELSPEEAMSLSANNVLWGCDICAEVCPLNRNAELTYIKEFTEGYRNTYSRGEDITGRAYEWRGEKIIRRNYDNLQDKK